MSEMTTEQLAEHNAQMTAHALRKIAKQFNLDTKDVQKCYVEASMEFIEVLTGHDRSEILAEAEKDGLDVSELKNV